MKYLCIAYEEEQQLNQLSEGEWQALREETLNYVDALRTSGRETRGNRPASEAKSQA